MFKKPFPSIRSMSIKKGQTVRVHYTGKFVDGVTFDSSEGKEPLEFTVGQGQVIPGFDEGVVGMSAGEKKTIEIEPENAYGPVDENARIELPRDQLPQDIEPKEGMRLTMQAPNGQVFYPLIKEVKEDSIILDLNHPLAGKKLIFDVEIIEVKDAPEAQEVKDEESEEHVHSENCNHD
jgi:FKBP-type peptidyl-prolyl cis-trans isomerase 2